jgi:tRNA 2-thiouridine synthesizing protein A
MTTDLNTISPAKTVDCRSMACPGPLLEAKKSIAGVAVGEVLEIMSGDEGSREDIPAWCSKSGHEYLGFVQRDGYDSIYVTRRK